MSVLSELPSKQFFEQAAAELAIGNDMVEKDWWVTQVLAFLATLHLPGFKIVFSGGTSLSKAHGLIKRFSEDIDFKVACDEKASNKRSFKYAVLGALEDAGFAVNRDSLIARDGNNFFAVNIDYDSYFPTVTGLRPHIQLEVTVAPPELTPIEHPVGSLLAKLKKDPAEVAAIACVDPVETAADKLSALVWRIPKQASGELPSDRSLVRHIHDLAALEQTVQDGMVFSNLVIGSLQRDNGRNKAMSLLSNGDKFRLLLDTLSASDKKYREEYDTFVKSVSYASEGAIPTYDVAVAALKRLVYLVIASSQVSLT